MAVRCWLAKGFRKAKDVWLAKGCKLGWLKMLAGKSIKDG